MKDEQMHLQFCSVAIKSLFMCYCVYVELFIGSIAKIFSDKFSLFKFTNIQLINISISSFSAKIYILYIRIKKTTQELAYEMSEGIVTADFFLHSIEMYFSFLKQFEFCTQAA